MVVALADTFWVVISYAFSARPDCLCLLDLSFFLIVAILGKMSEWDSLSKWVLGRGGKGPKPLSQAYCGCAAAMERCRMRQGSSLAEHPLDDSDSAALLPAALMQITDQGAGSNVSHSRGCV